jgi:hypothetical protein
MFPTWNNECARACLDHGQELKIGRHIGKFINSNGEFGYEFNGILYPYIGTACKALLLRGHPTRKTIQGPAHCRVKYRETWITLNSRREIYNEAHPQPQDARATEQRTTATWQNLPTALPPVPEQQVTITAPLPGTLEQQEHERRLLYNEILQLRRENAEMRHTLDQLRVLLLG